MKAFLRINIAFLATFATLSLVAQTDHKHLLKGDQNYIDQDFEQAELNYRRALEKQNSAQGTYNLGNSIYRQERHSEAIKHFEAAAESAENDAVKSNAFHNLGNAHYQAGQYKESIEAYKNALRLNPNDLSTKQNLLRAIRNLPPPEPQQQPQDGENQKDQQQQQQNQNQQQEQQDDQQQNDEQQQQEQPSDQPQEQTKELSKEEAEKLLEIMDQEEQKVQEKMRKAGSKGRQKKDW